MRVPTFGNDGIVDLKQNNDQVIDPLSDRDRPARHADGRRQRRRRRRRASIGRRADGQDEREGLHPRIRRADRQAAVDLPHDPVAGRVRQRDVAEGLVVLHGQHRRVGADQHRSRARHRVSAGRERRPAITSAPIGPATTCSRESLVAVDLQTGKRKWHFQLVHHGIWDHDIPCAPILVDIRRDGKIIKAVAQPTKQAFMYVFDRVTGQPLWPIEERPVPKGDVPGECVLADAAVPARRARPAVQLRLGRDSSTTI